MGKQGQMKQPAAGKQSSGLHNLALVSAVIGGGVVGHDYAQWVDVDPTAGAIAGLIISGILTAILESMRRGEKEIREGCVGIGLVLGGLLGGIAGARDVGGVEGFLGGAFGGAILGAICGAIISALISFVVLALLFISSGPVGLFLRGIVLQRFNEDDPTALSILSHDQISEVCANCWPLDALVYGLVT